MNRLATVLLVLALFLPVDTAAAQTTPLTAVVVSSCSGVTYVAGQYRPLTMDATGKLCLGGTISPSGAAGGDLGGTYPNPTVVSVADVTTGTLGVANGGTGTSTAFTQGSVVFAGASGVYSQDNTHLFYDATNNRLLVSANSGAPSAGAILDLYGADGTFISPRVNAFGGTPSLTLRRSDGTFASQTALATNDVIGQIAFSGLTTGTTFVSGAFLRCAANSAWTASNAESNCNILVTPNGSTTAAQAEVWTSALVTVVPPESLSSTLIVAGATTLSNAAVNFTGLATSSAGTTGTVCWTTGTGRINVDTTTTCLLSLEEFKLILRKGIPHASDEVARLTPIIFHYRKETPEYAGDPRVHYGLGAHATEAVDPNLVGYTPDGKLRGVRYADSVVALLVASQQELIRQNKALVAVNNNLAKRITKLEATRKWR